MLIYIYLLLKKVLVFTRLQNRFSFPVSAGQPIFYFAILFSYIIDIIMFFYYDSTIIYEDFELN